MRTRTREWNRKYCNILQLTRINCHVLNMCKFKNHTHLFYTHMVVCWIITLKKSLLWVVMKETYPRLIDPQKKEMRITQDRDSVVWTALYSWVHVMALWSLGSLREGCRFDSLMCFPMGQALFIRRCSRQASCLKWEVTLALKMAMV